MVLLLWRMLTETAHRKGGLEGGPGPRLCSPGTDPATWSGHLAGQLARRAQASFPHTHGMLMGLAQGLGLVEPVTEMLPVSAPSGFFHQPRLLRKCSQRRLWAALS